MILQLDGFGQSVFQYFGVYAFVVVGMAFVIYKLNTKLESTEERLQAQSERTIELMTKVSDKMPGLERVANLERNQLDIIEKIKEVKEAIK